MATYTYSIAGDTLNDKVSGGRLKPEIEASSITIALDMINTKGDILDIIFKAALSAGEETTLDGLVAAHSGEPISDPDKVEVESQPVFANKFLPDGRRIWNADNCEEFSINNAAKNLDFVIPKDVMKVNGLEIVNCKAGDKATLQVLDTPTGTVSGVANAVLRTFGTVYLPDEFYKRVSKYDADIIKGMTIRIIYDRKDVSLDPAADVFINYLLHEITA